MRTQVGLFFCTKMNEENDYPKKIISFDEQIKRLIDRGMLIDDIEEAKNFLRNVSYFRLQGFWWEFQVDKTNHKFKEATSFKSVIELYTFDRKLRLLIFDAIERIEISLRTKMIYYVSIEKDQWWFENSENFFNKDFFKDSLSEIDNELDRTKEIFIKSHYQKYGQSTRPPAYKTLEVISFGCLSKIYSNLNNDIEAKNRIASEFDLPNYNFLKSWLQTFNIIRNIIAHHSRLWNRNIDFPPKSLYQTEQSFINIPDNLNSFYHCVSCILFLLNKISVGHSLKNKFKTLLLENPSISILEMGFPIDWEEQEIWK